MAYVKIYKYKKQYSLDGGVTWQDVTPAEYVPSGDPIGYYDTLEECMAQYRTIQSGYTCVGYDKHNQDVYEVSYDNGVTWSVVSTSAGTLIETNSYDCGYVPPTPASPKFLLTLNDSSTVSAECDATSAITRDETNNYISSITSIEIGDCTTSIDMAAFASSNNLTSLTIGDNVTTIGPYAFQRCMNLTNLLIPSNVSNIGNGAFSYCYNLSRIIIEAVTPPILGSDDDTFYDTNNCPIYVPCESVNAYKLASGWSDYASRIQCIEPVFNGKYKLTLDDTSVVSAECDSSSSVTSSETQDYRHEIVSVEIGDCVTTIDDGAFFDEYMISSVTIGNNVTSISENAFTMCTELSEIVIPDNVTSIGYAAFAQCTVLTSITISSGIISIGESAFEETSPRAIIINATTPPTLGANAFRYTDNCPIYVPCASVDAYKAASGWSEYRARIRGIQPCTLPPKYVLTLNDSSTVSAECNSSLSVTSGDVSSQYSGSVVSAVIGDCVSNIGQRAFSYSSGLTSVTLSDSVTSLSAAAFSYCSGLTSIDIPDSVTKIGGTVFTRCFSLTSVTIGSGCTAIGQQAFYNCTALTSVTIEATSPPTLGSNVFYNSNCPIYVPSASVNAYKSASGWSNYSSRIQAIP